MRAANDFFIKYRHGIYDDKRYRQIWATDRIVIPIAFCCVTILLSTSYSQNKMISAHRAQAYAISTATTICPKARLGIISRQGVHFDAIPFTNRFTGIQESTPLVAAAWCLRPGHSLTADEWLDFIDIYSSLYIAAARQWSRAVEADEQGISLTFSAWKNDVLTKLLINFTRYLFWWDRIRPSRRPPDGKHFAYNHDNGAWYVISRNKTRQLILIYVKRPEISALGEEYAYRQTPFLKIASMTVTPWCARMKQAIISRCRLVKSNSTKVFSANGRALQHIS